MIFDAFQAQSVASNSLASRGDVQKILTDIKKAAATGSYFLHIASEDDFIRAYLRTQGYRVKDHFREDATPYLQPDGFHVFWNNPTR